MVTNKLIKLDQACQWNNNCKLFKNLHHLRGLICQTWMRFNFSLQRVRLLRVIVNSKCKKLWVHLGTWAYADSHLRKNKLKTTNGQSTQLKSKRMSKTYISKFKLNSTEQLCMKLKKVKNLSHHLKEVHVNLLLRATNMLWRIIQIISATAKLLSAQESSKLLYHNNNKKFYAK